MSESIQNLNINNENLLLVDILNVMYNDNIRQINNLTESNNEIRRIITGLLSNPSSRERSLPYRGRRNNIRNSRTNTTTGANSNNTNGARVGITSNIPYIYDSFQEYYIPTTSINSLSSQLDNTIFNNDFINTIAETFLQPVDVNPTQQQIEIATRNVRYSDILSPVNISCPISLETFNDNDIVTVIRFCGHIFKPDDLNRWFRSNCKCPVCRYDIRNYRQTS
jgi:hypothetical protein